MNREPSRHQRLSLPYWRSSPQGRRGSQRKSINRNSPVDLRALCGEPFFYFKLNSAVTCAETVPVWTEKSSVGAGVAALGAAADMARAIRGITIRGFSKVSTEA